MYSTSSIMLSLVRVSWWSKMRDSLRARQPRRFSSPLTYRAEVSTTGPWNSVVHGGGEGEWGEGRGGR